MANNTQFAIAVHLLAGLGSREGGMVISADLASSVNTSASFIRRVMAKLSKAGLVLTSTGKGGACRLARKPRDISMLEVYRAVEAPKVFAPHSYVPSPGCSVSCNIKLALNNVLEKSQTAFEASLERITLAEVISNL
jgi:Rrf2 family protein